MAWSGLSDWFWSEAWWLPPGYTWHSLATAQHFRYPASNDLFIYPFAIAAFFFFLRHVVLVNFVFRPIGHAFGVTTTKIKPPAPNSTLESVFHRGKRDPEAVVRAAGALGWTERQVERWLRQRAASARPSNMTKLCDLAWEFTYYSCYSVLGVILLWDKAWLWDIDHAFIGFPEQSLEDDVWWYYMISLGYYWNMTFAHFFEYYRKDFMQFFIHHLLTIALLCFSWVTNFVRLGTLVLLVHECTDIPMLLAKMCKLCGHAHYMDPIFVVFLLLWLATRTGLYPFWIMRATLFRAHVILYPMWYPVYYIFNGMLIMLMLLHVMWTYYILRIVLRKLQSNQIVQDVRSSEGSVGASDDSDQQHHAKDD